MLFSGCPISLFFLSLLLTLAGRYMEFQSQIIPYRQTGKFSKITLDYIEQASALRPFYEHEVSIEGIKAAVERRKKFHTNRPLLVQELTRQYHHAGLTGRVKENIESLLDENTFTVCTAHQPNIFTGHLYFIYKIVHTIKMAACLREQLPQYHFVPVFFMGSEDADLEELNHIVVDGTPYVWHTNQSGAVGRMVIDQEFINLIEKIASRILVEKHGDHIIRLVRECYIKGRTVEEATFLFVHSLFKEEGLLVFLPDNAAYKKEMTAVFEEDILLHTPAAIVENTSARLSAHYKAQAHPREINLFYLRDDIRNRIVKVKDQYAVHGTDIIFSKEAILQELYQHPERFSPNVILRGLFQEVLLPDVAWIGGGGELAYWLQLKDVFEKYQVPYPVLVLRNSFLIIEEKQRKQLEKMRLHAADLFRGRETLLNEMVKKESEHTLTLDNEKKKISGVYSAIRDLLKNIDTTLVEHTAALETRQMKMLDALEKKMFRAEKRKYLSWENQLGKLYTDLFPGDGLQERSENFMLFYAKYGEDFFKMLYNASPVLEPHFTILET